MQCDFGAVVARAARLVSRIEIPVFILAGWPSPRLCVCTLGNLTKENSAVGQVLSYPALSIEMAITQLVLHLA
jgi:hypothetical protein